VHRGQHHLDGLVDLIRPLLLERGRL
jgi:hypothetical protein